MMKKSSKRWQCLLIYILLMVLECFGNPEERVRNLTAHSNQEVVRELMRRSKAAEIKNNMNDDIDPCEDFYAFACGNWYKVYPALSIEQITTGLFERMSQGFNRKLLNHLNDPIQLDNNFETDKKVYDFYKSCMRVRKIDNTYIEKLKELISEFGEMPALVGSTWNADNSFDWLEVVAKILHKYGRDIILGLEVLPDFNENTKNRVYMGQPDFPLESRTMYLDPVTETYRHSYLFKISDDLKKYLKLKTSDAGKVAVEILEFEIALARGMVDERDGFDLSDMSILTTVEDLQKKYYPTIDIKKMINITFNSLDVGPIYEFIEGYQKNLIQVIKKTPKSTQANYIFYNLLREFSLKLGKNDNKHKNVCLEKTKKFFAKNLDNMMYRMLYSKETERDVELIWNELKTTFKEQLQSNQFKWITRETRKYALEKLEKMQLEINSYKDENFDEEFAQLSIDQYDYIGNLKRIMQYLSQRNQAELHKPPKKLEDGELLSYTPANVILENTIKIPVSLLQPNYLWAANYPNALKFGTLASLIGHEIIHGFDDSGRKFDKDGNNNDWWDTESTEAFINKTKCFSEQYSRYTYAGRYLPKSASQSENIADNGGLRLAYAAYLKWFRNAKNSGVNMDLETLPTTNYTSKQLFFISYAQVWCNEVHPEIQDLQTSTDQHVPGKYRVIGPLSNFEEFSKEFNCREGRKMNPRRKCRIY